MKDKFGDWLIGTSISALVLVFLSSAGKMLAVLAFGPVSHIISPAILAVTSYSAVSVLWGLPKNHPGFYFFGMITGIAIYFVWIMPNFL